MIIYLFNMVIYNNLSMNDLTVINKNQMVIYGQY